MKKFLVSALAMFVLASFGLVFAQNNTANHALEVRIPDLLMLRITDGTDNGSVGSPVVNFNFVDDASGLADYMAMVENGEEANLEPTSSNFGDVVVLSNRVSWTVDVTATAFTFADNVANDPLDPLNPEAASGLVLSDITVASTATTDSVLTSRLASFALQTTPLDIAGGTRTQGWKSLGIAGSGYRITVDGDEAPGTYTTTVTYTVTAP